MTGLLIVIIWAHLGFVITLGTRSRRNVIGRDHGWCHVSRLLAAGPFIWLLAMNEILRSKSRRTHHAIRSLFISMLL